MLSVCVIMHQNQSVKFTTRCLILGKYWNILECMKNIKILKRWNTLLRKILWMKRGFASRNSSGILFPLWDRVIAGFVVGLVLNSWTLKIWEPKWPFWRYYWTFRAAVPLENLVTLWGSINNILGRVVLFVSVDVCKHVVTCTCSVSSMLHLLFSKS
jgi:hypothetical protein